MYLTLKEKYWEGQGFMFAADRLQKTHRAHCML